MPKQPKKPKQQKRTKAVGATSGANVCNSILHDLTQQFFTLGHTVCLTTGCLNAMSLGALAAASKQCHKLSKAEQDRTGWWIYVVGGNSEGVRDSVLVERYSTTEDMWETLPPLPHACVRTTVSVVVAESSLYVLGMRNESQPREQETWMFVRFDPHQRCWEKLLPPPFLAICENMYAVALAGYIYVTDSRRLMRYRRTRGWEVLRINLKNEANLFVRISQLIVAQGALYALTSSSHGYSGSGLYGLCRYKPALDQWETLNLKDDLVGVSAADVEYSAVAIGSHIFVTSVSEECAEVGRDNDYWYHKAFCWTYDTRTGKWELVAPMPTVRRMGQLTAFRRCAFFIGGVTRSDGEDDESDCNAVEAWGPPGERNYWKVFQETKGIAPQLFAVTRNGDGEHLYAIGGTHPFLPLDRCMVERLSMDENNEGWKKCSDVLSIKNYCERGVAAVPAAKIEA